MTSEESLVRRSLEAWNENDWKALEGMWDPDGEIVAPEGWPEAGPRSGWPAIREQFEVIKDSWSEERSEPIAIELIGDRAFAHVRWTVRGEASGAALATEMWMLYEFREGRISRIQYFMDGEAAREAARTGPGDEG